MLAAQFGKVHRPAVITTTRKEEKINMLLQNGADYNLIDDGNLSNQINNIFPRGVNKVRN